MIKKTYSAFVLSSVSCVSLISLDFSISKTIGIYAKLGKGV